jgi:transposase
MASPKVIPVKESVETLKRILKSSTPLIAPRIRMLIEIKKKEDIGISKRDLSEIVGSNQNSIQKWRTMYCEGGLDLLCSHKKKGFKPTVFDKEEHRALESKLNDPFSGLRGYKELQTWVNTEFGKDIKYNTLLKYCIRNFESSLKVARKSHVKKDAQAVETFKKTSLKSVKKQSAKKGKGSLP